MDDKTTELLKLFEKADYYIQLPATVIEQMEQLIAAGADVNARGKTGSPILHLLIQYSYFSCNYRPLLKKMIAHPQIQKDARDEYGATALHHAVDNNDSELVSLLLNAGWHINAQQYHGWTPLHKAQAGTVRQILLAHPNVDVELRDNQEKTAAECWREFPIKPRQPAGCQL